MNIPDWYNVKEDYIVVHPKHKPNMRKQDGISFTNYSPFLPIGGDE